LFYNSCMIDVSDIKLNPGLSTAEARCSLTEATYDAVACNGPGPNGREMYLRG